MSERLKQNLKALDRSQPALASYLRRCNWTAAAAVAEVPLQTLPEAPHLFFVGAAGATLQAAIASGRNCTVWERDPIRLRDFLGAVDCQAALQTKRLKLLCGLDILEARLDAETALVQHPLLASRWGRELAWLQQQPTKRALIVDGGLVVDDLSAALQAEGYGLWTWEITRMQPAELAEIARRFGAQVVFAVNHWPGLPEATTALGLPLHVWEIDPALDPIRPPQRSVALSHVWTWRQAQVEVYQKAGYPVSYLPLAADTEKRQPMPMTDAERAEVEAPVVFVGRSMVLEGLRYRKQVEAEFQAFLPTVGRPAASATTVIEGILTEQRTMPAHFCLPALMDKACPGFRAQAKVHDPALLLGEVVAAEWRLNVAANIMDMGLEVWGDNGWQVLKNLRWRGAAGHRQQLSRIYSGQGIHLDIGRIYQPDIVTLRVFEVLACGGFLLAAWSPDILSLIHI